MPEKADILQVHLGFRLHRFRHRIQDVGLRTFLRTNGRHALSCEPGNAARGFCRKPHAARPETPWHHPLPGRRLRSNRPRGAHCQLGRGFQPPAFRFADLRFRSESSSHPADRQGFACKPREGALSAFPKATGQARDILVAPFISADNHQHTLARRCHTALIVSDSHFESRWLEGWHDAAPTRPLPHDVLIQDRQAVGHVAYRL